MKWFRDYSKLISTAIMSIGGHLSDFFEEYGKGLVNIFTTVWETIKNVLTVALMFLL